MTLVGVSESCRAVSLATLEPRYLEPSGLDQVPEFYSRISVNECMVPVSAQGLGGVPMIFVNLEKGWLFVYARIWSECCLLLFWCAVRILPGPRVMNGMSFVGVHSKMSLKIQQHIFCSISDSSAERLNPRARFWRLCREASGCGWSLCWRTLNVHSGDDPTSPPG